MQLTPAQRRFYIDPVQDPTITTTHVLVLEERVARGVHLDKIVAVKPERYNGDYRHWWITEEGDYVYGAPINPQNISPRRTLIAPGGDGWFWLGSPGRRTGDSYLLSEVKRSDGRQLPGRGNTGGVVLEVPAAVLGAPWAEELFPLPGDSDVVVQAKLNLAEQRWMHRRAKAEIMRQGIGRGWDDDLVTLREDGRLPEPEFGVYYRGQVMIDPMGSAATLSDRDSERLQDLRNRVPVLGAGTEVQTLIGVRVNVPLRVSVSTFNNVRDLSVSTIKEHLRSAVGDYSAVPGDFSLTPVLRSIAS
jgi:hypothetical protein